MLIDKINSIPLFRPLGLSESLRDVCVIIFNSDLSKLERLHAARPSLNINRVIIPDLADEICKKTYLQLDGKQIPCSPVEELGLFPELEKIFVYPDNIVKATVALSRLGILGGKFSVRNFHLFGDEPPMHSVREALPNFFRNHAQKLAEAMELFEDENSKELFAARVKAIISGNAAFMPIAAHEEYFHPLVHPEKGDMMIDGGVSDMVQSQEKFLNAVGPGGHVFGFEPIASMARKAMKALEPYPNYHMQMQGLADKEGAAIFEDLRDSSHMLAEGGKGTGISCPLISIDAFCRKHHLSHVNCIKLDVEGAELLALKGAEQTIRSMFPKLIVCLYHKPQDMYEIPEYIHKIAPGYKLYLAHSSCQFTDTILYGLPPAKQ